MQSPRNTAEEIQVLAKSVLARQVKDELESSGNLPEQKIKAVRGLIDRFIDPRAVGMAEEIQALAKSVLARQVRDVLTDESMSPEEKVEHVRGLIQYFIVDPAVR